MYVVKRLHRTFLNKENHCLFKREKWMKWSMYSGYFRNLPLLVVKGKTIILHTRCHKFSILILNTKRLVKWKFLLFFSILNFVDLYTKLIYICQKHLSYSNCETNQTKEKMLIHFQFLRKVNWVLILTSSCVSFLENSINIKNWISTYIPSHVSWTWVLTVKSWAKLFFFFFSNKLNLNQ